ncbi:pyruvate dehydrogenase E1 component beta subunit [Diplocarpon rosae]|nr:pyruvate dehydrogenase E1 component beta subunit [Diplocarpon rosae]
MRVLHRAISRGVPPSRCRSSYSIFQTPINRWHSTLPAARLNIPTDFSTTSILEHTSQSALQNPEILTDTRNGTTKRMNLFQSINDALSLALAADESVILFGEDVAFGGVFRCSMGLAENFGSERVFNTPLSEQGIVGFGIGAAAEGMKAIAEIQFADYVYPAFDQLVNEAAKFRYRDGKEGRNSGGLTVRMPCGGVGHGALYHSQSPESLFTHIPGLRVIMPRSPIQAKGLLLSAIASKDPCVFMEPKALYRAAVEQVPTGLYYLPLSKAEILKEGSDLTIVSYGHPLYTCSAAIEKAETDLGISIELIDLRTVYPWDKECVFKSVRKTSRCVVVHESMINAGIGAEVAASIQEDTETFLRLEAPVLRVAGWSVHMGLIFERFNIPDVAKPLSTTETTIQSERVSCDSRGIPTLANTCAMSSPLATVSAFVEGAPPGELADVVADIKALTIDTPALVSQLGPAFEKYNEEQFATVKLPGSSQHVGSKASAVQSYVLESSQSDLIKSLSKALSSHVKEHYSNASYGVFPIEDDSKIALLVVANKYSPNNFWNGRWRSLYILDPSSSSLSGSIKVDVHYYEDGNVRLLTTKPVSASVSSSSATTIVREITNAEKKYQEEVNKGFNNLSEGAFKGLRRQLPITRQKIEWDKIAGYRLGQDIGGGSTKR